MRNLASLRGRDLIGSADISAAELGSLLDAGARLKAARAAGRSPFAGPHRPLAGRVIALVFDRPSLRTMASFEVGTFGLGGSVVDLSGEKVALGRREAVRDVARVLERWVDAVIVRTPSHEAVAELAEWAGVPVVNALTDLEHPCQALADLLTIRERFGRLEGIVVTFVGDGNNVYHSLAQAGAIAGMEVRIAHPAGYGPRPEIPERATALAAASGGRIVVGGDPRAAVAGAHVVYTDAWTSMGQEAESAVRRQAFEGFRVDDALLSGARPDAVVLHCLPAHRGEEITDEVLDGPRSLVFDQAENRLHAQNALMLALLTGSDGVDEAAAG